MCENTCVHLCALVLLPGSPGIEWVSNQYKCNLRTSRASGRGEAWREPGRGQQEEQEGQSGTWGWAGFAEGERCGRRQLVQGRLTRSQQDPRMWVQEAKSPEQQTCDPSTSCRGRDCGVGGARRHTFSYPAWQVEAGASSSGLPEVGSGPGHFPSLPSRLHGGGCADCLHLCPG